MTRTGLQRLEPILESIGPLTVAVSGGVDSMTLSAVAHRVLGANAHMMHAISPAVPSDATARVRRYAKRLGWRLVIVDAGEFADPDYISNPANRCYFCKTNLYSTMSARADTVIASGTNLDDLGDYRPGLQAASAHGVRHPYVEAGIDKRTVRAIAHGLGFDDLAELPASPCLSSRVETGIRIDPPSLQAVYRAERLVQEALSPVTLRCRIRHDAVVVELDAQTLTRLDDGVCAHLSGLVHDLFRAVGVEHQVQFQVYRMGSAFLRAST